ncbi:hypothetical protein [Aquisphaera giovannonii]|uniref:hypothetical protein n=1 Tax=Aquisphaera giovannonii TaxID=406548 RepID=UPI0011E035C8|nr:hypothetical protein [Aquisphaera giovannonii]
MIATLQVVDGQAAYYDELPRTIRGLHDYMGYPDFIDPDGKFARRADGTVILGFGKYKSRPLEAVARNDPGFLEWMLRSDFSEEAKAVARGALDTLSKGANKSHRGSTAVRTTSRNHTRGHS